MVSDRIVMDVYYTTCGRRGCVEEALSNFIDRIAGFGCRIVIGSSTSPSGATRVVERCRGGCPSVVRKVCRARGRCSGGVSVARGVFLPTMAKGCITVYRKSSC